MTATGAARGNPPGGSARIAGLDGIRALSILVVFAAHAGLPVLVNGSTGVTVFFFLSGYLITTLLRQEQERNGRLDLRAFFARRSLRILPPLYLVYAAAVAATALGVVPGRVDPSAVVAQASHLTNYWIIVAGRDGVPGSTLALWSLAVEEHFYLVFPLLLVALHRWVPRRRHQALVLLALSGLVLLWRAWLVYVTGAGFDRIYLATDTRIDSLLLGAALALGANPALDPVRGSRRLWARVVLPVAGAAFWSAQAPTTGSWALVWGYTVQGLLLGALFVAVVHLRGGWVGRLLEHPLLVRLGVLSYGTYLVHELAIELVRTHLTADVWRGALAAFVLSLAAAQVLHSLVERPCTRLRARLVAPSRPRTLQS